MARVTAAIISGIVATSLWTAPVLAKPGGSLKTYKGFVAKTLKLKPSGTKRVEGGSASDWYYSFAGKAPTGLPVELTVQASGDTVYSQALTVTTKVGNTKDVDAVVALAESFWQEATDGHGKEVSRYIARQIAAGQPQAMSKYRHTALSMTKVSAGSQLVWVIGAEQTK